MCMLTVLPMPGLLDDAMTERLHNGASFNNDGHGWAVISEGRILTGKSMDINLAVDAFRVAYAKGDGPAIFHSRYATHGSETIANVHPFPARKIANTYIAHNGILPADAWPSALDDRSDTRLFADDIFPKQYARLDSPKVRGRLGKYLGSNKIAVLTTNRRYRRQLYVFGLELGNWESGVWFSNYDHEGYFDRHKSATGGWVLGGKDKGDGSDECLWCNVQAVNDMDVCENCGTCQDCYQPYRECSCFIPSKGRGMDAPSSTPFRSVVDERQEAERLSALDR